MRSKDVAILSIILIIAGLSTWFLPVSKRLQIESVTTFYASTQTAPIQIVSTSTQTTEIEKKTLVNKYFVWVPITDTLADRGIKSVEVTIVPMRPQVREKWKDNPYAAISLEYELHVEARLQNAKFSYENGLVFNLAGGYSPEELISNYDRIPRYGGILMTPSYVYYSGSGSYYYSDSSEYRERVEFYEDYCQFYWYWPDRPYLILSVAFVDLPPSWERRVPWRVRSRVDTLIQDKTIRETSLQIETHTSTSIRTFTYTEYSVYESTETMESPIKEREIVAPLLLTASAILLTIPILAQRRKRKAPEKDSAH